MRTEYYTYIQKNSVEGSGTAHSYVRALDMLGLVLKNRTTEFTHHSDIWSIQIPETIEQLYEFILNEQRKKESGIFSGHTPSSYWEGGYYSAALGSYKNFLIAYRYIRQHEERLWKIYKEAKKPSSKLSNELENAAFEEIEKIIPERCRIFQPDHQPLPLDSVVKQSTSLKGSVFIGTLIAVACTL